jgi:hypothetical protein
MLTERNPHAQWRFELARQISARLRPFTGIQAIVVGGSVARGYADEYSDLELPLFWNEPPSDAIRHAIVQVLYADFLYPYNGPANEDNLLIKGFQVDLWHCTVTNEEAVFDAVLHHDSTDLSDSNFMDTIRACIPLHGEALIARWKELAQGYPDTLIVRNVQEQLPHLSAGHLSIHAARNHAGLVYAGINELQQRLFHVLLALNRQYFPTYKWMYQTIESMSIKPRDTTRRMYDSFHVRLPRAVEDTLALCRETLALIEQQVPQIDTSLAHKALQPPRAAQTIPIRLDQ